MAEPDIKVSEDEELEKLKKWWRENGTSTIAGVVLGLVAVFGWRGWGEYQGNLSRQASAQYNQLLSAVARDQVDAVVQLSTELKKDYASTPYAGLSALGLARVYMDIGERDKAKQQLGWVLEHGDDESVRHLARIGLAEVMLDGGEYDAALALVEGAGSGSFTAAYEAIKGDLYRARGELSKARLAYQQALLAGARPRDLVQMKLDDLGPGNDGSPAS